MIGSNSTALRQHAYSVFTASQREREFGGSAPDSVRRLLIPDLPSGEHPGPKRLVEAKSALGVPGVPPARGAVRESLLRGARTASRASLANPPAPEGGPEPTQDEIRRRAYEIFERRGAIPGDAVADWLAAEAELRRERGLG